MGEEEEEEDPVEGSVEGSVEGCAGRWEALRPQDRHHWRQGRTNPEGSNLEVRRTRPASAPARPHLQEKKEERRHQRTHRHSLSSEGVDVSGFCAEEWVSVQLYEAVGAVDPYPPGPLRKHRPASRGKSRLSRWCDQGWRCGSLHCSDR